MMDLQAELNLAYLFISHDLSVVQHIANDVLVMYSGPHGRAQAKETLLFAPARATPTPWR